MTEQRSNHKIPRRTFLKVCAAAAAAGLTACSKTQAAAALPELTVGSDNYPPFIYLNNDSTPTGIDVDIATEAFARMGYAVRFEIIDWEQKTNLVESGAIDCIWSCFSMDGREEVYRWAGPYMVSRQVAAVDADSSIRTLGDLAGKTIAVQSTGKPEEIFLSGSDPRIPQTVEVFSTEDRSVQYAMLACGYESRKVVMVGDAMGDAQAAAANGVAFVPILPGREAASWRRLQEEALPKLLHGTFSPAYQAELIAALRSALHG